jgi:hypothetical protein
VPPAEHLFPMSWNPGNLMAALTAIPGLAGAARIGVDSITPGMAQLLGATFPDARRRRVAHREVRRESDDDVRAIRAPSRWREETLQAEARPPSRQGALTSRWWCVQEHMASSGVDPGLRADDHGCRRASLVTDRAIAAGDLVHLRVGVLRDGWEGWLSRTVVCGATPSAALREAFGTWHAAIEAVIVRCRPGVPVGELRGAGAGVTVDGVGMGHEELADADRLEAGMVIAIEVAEGDVLGSETVLVTTAGCEPLTTLPHVDLTAARIRGRP